MQEAVADVSSRAAELATGRRPDPAAVNRIVSDLMAGGREVIFATALLTAAAEGEHDITQTPSKFWPEGYEMLFGIPASLLIFFLLWKFAGPTVKKMMAHPHRKDPSRARCR